MAENIFERIDGTTEEIEGAIATATNEIAVRIDGATEEIEGAVAASTAETGRRIDKLRNVIVVRKTAGFVFFSIMLATLLGLAIFGITHMKPFLKPDYDPLTGTFLNMVWNPNYIFVIVGFPLAFLVYMLYMTNWGCCDDEDAEGAEDAER